MSDMSRPHLPPSAADHERHDALLIAQLVAGDPLDDGRQSEAEQLVSTCPGCARLAGDLRALSAVVAQEPVPPRRRDFHISPEQAEGLRGNTLTRLLRGFSAPRSAAFRPAAAGLLSVGLVFVVAGYVWPDGDTTSPSAEPNLAPAAVEERFEATLPPFDELLRSQGGAPAEALEAFADDQLADDQLADGGALRSLSQKSSVEGIESDSEDDEAAWTEALAESLPRAPDVDALVAAEPELGMAEGLGSDLAPNEVATGEVAVDGTIPGAAEPPLVEDLAVSDVVDDGVTMDTLLLAAGVGLALVGVALLLLAWLVRRTTDPLLR